MGKKGKKNKKNRTNKNASNSDGYYHKTRGGNKSRTNVQSHTNAPNTDGYYYVDPNNAPPPQEAYALCIDLVTDDLLNAVLSRGLRREMDKITLETYFYRIVQSMSSAPQKLFQLVHAVLIGLTKGPPAINKRLFLFGNNEPWPILHWVCQWKLLKFNASGSVAFGDELVDMVLKAGANVNNKIANDTNAMFFAVKYADIMAIECLIRAGINLQKLDVFGRTCMYNALEHPRPIIIEKLLSAGLDANEMILSGKKNDDDKIIEYEASLVDIVMSLFWKAASGQQLISWRLFGIPTSANIGETLLLLRQKGARFTENSKSDLSMTKHFFTDEKSFDQKLLPYKKVFKETTSYLVGNTVPERFCRFRANPTELEEQENRSIEAECRICFDSPIKKPVTLPCGHSFCRTCILNYAHQDNGANKKTCPLCRTPLSLDITTPDFQSLPELDSRTNCREVGLSRMMGSQRCDESFDSRVDHLNENQIISESKFRGIFNTRDSVDILREKIKEESMVGLVNSHVRNGAVHPLPMIMDLGATINGMSRTEELYISPDDGPGCIDVLVNGVPILARISNRSLFTTVSKQVVAALGLKKIEQLRTRKFVAANGHKMSIATCLEPISIGIGDIEVVLSNAVELVDVNEMFGIQLGEDFLTSARWCPIDVEIDKGGSYMRTANHDCETGYILTTPSKSTLRFYSLDGRIAHVPILPFRPFEGHINFLVSLKMSANYDECLWCRRMFPDGMLSCQICQNAGKKATYCDERCQLAGYKCHKRFHAEIT